MKKTIKVIAIVLFAILVVSALTQGALAVDPSTFESSFSGAGNTAGTSIGKIVNSVLNIVKIVGTGIAIIMLVVLAIKYISAAPGDKAEIKKHAVVYIVGAVVLFGASGILGIIQGFISDNKLDAGSASSGS